MSRGRRVALFAGAGVMLAVLGGVAAVVTLRTTWFREQVRRRIVSSIEEAVGGRVEFGTFHFDWRTMRVEARRFVVHGTEPSGAAPLFQAETAEVGLKIISMLRRKVDLDSLTIQKPALYITVSADGSTNIPAPLLTESSRVLDLAIRKLVVKNGVVDFASRKFPLNITGENVNAEMFYSAAGPRYEGNLSARQLRVDADGFPVPLDVDASLAIEKNRLTVSNAVLHTSKSSVRVRGTAAYLQSLQAECEFDGRLFLSELGAQGVVAVSGKANYEGESNYSVNAKLSGQGLAYRQGAIRVEGVRMTSALDLTSNKMEFRGLRLWTADGDFSGRAELEKFQQLHIEGEIRNAPVQKVVQRWNGTVSGPVQVEGEVAGTRIQGVKARAQLAVSPAPGEVPIEGLLQLAYDQRSGALELTNSHLATHSTRAQFNGRLNQALHVEFESRNLEDVLPALAILSDTAPKSIPIKLKGGVARVTGQVTGDTRNPQFSGHVSVSRFIWEGRECDLLSADVTASPSSAQFRKVSVEQGPLRLRGDGGIALKEWRPEPGSAISGVFSLAGAELAALVAETGAKLPLRGAVSGSFHAAGTLKAPRSAGTFSVSHGEAYGQSFDRAQGEIQLSDGLVEVRSGTVQAASAHMQWSAAWQDGQFRFAVAGRKIALAQLHAVESLRQGISGTAELKLSGRGTVRQLTALDGEVTIEKLAIDRKTLGSASLKAETKGDALTIEGTAVMQGAKIAGKGEWRLADGYPGQVRLDFPNLDIAMVQNWLQRIQSPGKPAKSLPFDGALSGNAVLTGSALDPDNWKVRVELSSVELNRERKDDFVIRNAGPVLLAGDSKGVRIEQAQFAGKDTKLQATGSLSFRARNAFDLRVRGGINLAILKDFVNDLTASGRAILDASIRGSWAQPDLYGRLEFRNASVFLTDVPNGIERANGVVFFFQDRATIDSFTAETGGGRLTLGGFVGFGGQELVYRVQMKSEQVRVRYPEGVSTTLNGSLNLAGTATRSLLSGDITVLRSSISPRTDFAALLESASERLFTPPGENKLLQGMQFDIHVATAAGAKFETSLTSDVQAQASLRLRGSSAKPVLLGRISVTQGDINFFGNHYSINRGEITFVNPVKVEPVLDLNLETRSRGILIDITFSGTLNKLNVNYRSDPPLQSSEIIALLALGRAPASIPTVGGSPSIQSPSSLQGVPNSVLNQAMAGPATSRLQRLFGASRIKIDPTLTGVENIPEARLTMEQQISKDIVFTYITNLNKGQQQIVRVEWGFAKKWSVVAIREENGLFGVDLLYKRRF